jgi:probable phosphoglycerate mutase
MSGGTILLVRHGETEWNLTRRYQGWGDSPLTPVGLAQAEAIGNFLRTLPGIERASLISSPIGRAYRTAGIIQECLGRAAPIQTDGRLREISLGSWDGLDREQIAGLRPGLMDGDGRYEWYFRTPDGETFDGFAGRIGAWLTEHRDRDLVVVTHGIVTRVLRGLYAGLPRAQALQLPVLQDRIWRLAGGTIQEIAVLGSTPSPP